MKMMDRAKKKNKDFILVGKGIFFKNSGILAVGDLQIGYETMLREKGFYLPLNQLKKTIEDLKAIIDKIQREGHEINKVILLGDIKHHFGFQIEEKYHVREVLEFIENEIGRNNLILIRGNHEKFNLDGRDYKDFYIDNTENSTKTIFLHGDKEFPELKDKSIKRIIMGHIHPAVTLKDKEDIKKEKFKCFLIGKWKRKDVIILPSFFPLKEGTSLNEGDLSRNDYNEDFGIVPLSELKKFDVFIVGKDGIYNFGKLKSL